MTRKILAQKHCVRARVILHCVSTKDYTAFVFWELVVQFRILSMTQVHQRSKLNRVSFFVSVPKLPSCFLPGNLAMLKFSPIGPTLCQRRLLHPLFSLLEGEEVVCAQSCTESWNDTPLVFMTISSFLERGIFVIHELRFYAFKSSYEFCRRMALLPAHVHRIAALVKTPSMSLRLFFLSFLATCRA